MIRPKEKKKPSACFMVKPIHSSSVTLFFPFSSMRWRCHISDNHQEPLFTPQGASPATVALPHYTHALINVKVSVSSPPTAYLWECGRKPEHPDENDANTGIWHAESNHCVKILLMQNLLRSGCRFLLHSKHNFFL